MGQARYWLKAQKAVTKLGTPTHTATDSITGVLFFFCLLGKREKLACKASEMTFLLCPFYFSFHPWSSNTSRRRKRATTTATASLLFCLFFSGPGVQERLSQKWDHDRRKEGKASEERIPLLPILLVIITGNGKWRESERASENFCKIDRLFFGY